MCVFCSLFIYTYYIHISIFKKKHIVSLVNIIEWNKQQQQKKTNYTLYVR